MLLKCFRLRISPLITDYGIGVNPLLFNLIDDETEEQVTYHIVGEYEADITKKRISIVSPIAKALIGKLVGDIVEVSTPNGSKSYEVIEVEYNELDL